MIDNNFKFGKEIFVQQFEGSIGQKYEVIEELEVGEFFRLATAKNKKSDEVRAIKQLSKKKILNEDLEKFKKEINVLKTLDHPNIIKLYEIFETQKHLYLVYEKCNGGNLFEDLINRMESGHMYSEKEVAIIIRQIMSALEYCSQKKIGHYNLTMENILFLNEKKLDSGLKDKKTKKTKNLNLIDEIKNPIKIIEFGSSQINKQEFNSRLETNYFVPPEILEGNYTEKCDIWSAGVLLYILLSGNPPFNGSNEIEVYKKILGKKFEFTKEFDNVSREVKDLIKHMIAPENERYSASKILADPWFKKIIKDKELKELKINPSFLIEYNKVSKLKKLILLFIASRISNKEINHLKEIFQVFDKNNDGLIIYEEFKDGLNQILTEKISDDQMRDYFNAIDTSKNGKIEYTEFIAATLDKKNYLKKKKLKQAFEMLDRNHSGKIEKEEIKGILKLQSNDEIITELIEKVDANKDGEIDYNEFLDFMGYKKEK